MRYRSIIVALLVLCLSVLTTAGKVWAADDTPLTYEEIGSGIAANCPILDENARGSFSIDSGQSYILRDVCLQPTAFLVKEESSSKGKKPRFVPVRLTTRKTSTLGPLRGTIQTNSDDSLTFAEKEGMDFSPLTVQIPGGNKRVPVLFTIKELVATTQPNMKSINTSTDFTGEFRVPEYRTAAFLDSRGRGASSGYDVAVGVITNQDSEKLERANVKRFESGQKGTISLQVAKVDSRAGEIGGTFESEQLSDTEFGVHEPHEVKIRGLFYGRVEPEPTV